MSRIISVSRRTDIPAFYSDWFERRLEQGFAGWENPFGGQRYLVSLKREEVLAFVFWSKNYRPFLPVLQKIKELQYPVVFNYSITGLPQKFECQLVPTEDSIESLMELSHIYSPEHINWRYDPIVLSSATPPEYHVQRFKELCNKLEGYVKRCYFSYAIKYGKVERNFKRFEAEHQESFYDATYEERINLANKLSEIAADHGIDMFSCCGDYLIGGNIKKAHCIDGQTISNLYYDGSWNGVKSPTRKECGCNKSTDIGKYDTCPHGCIYCYANLNKEKAAAIYSTHDPEAAFLGYSKAESDKLVEEIKSKLSQKKDPKASSKEQQLKLEF